jgi:hypothetical protein
MMPSNGPKMPAPYSVHTPKNAGNYKSQHQDCLDHGLPSRPHRSNSPYPHRFRLALRVYHVAETQCSPGGFREFRWGNPRSMVTGQNKLPLIRQQDRLCRDTGSDRLWAVRMQLALHRLETLSTPSSFVSPFLALSFSSHGWTTTVYCPALRNTVKPASEVRARHCSVSRSIGPI